MNEMTNILIRLLRELSVQASTDTLGDRERGFLNREYTSLPTRSIGLETALNLTVSRSLTKKNERDQFVIQVGTNGTTPEMNQDTISISLQALNLALKA